MPRSFLWSSGETDSHLAVRIKSYFQCSEHKKIFKTDQRLPGKILTKASLSILRENVWKVYIRKWLKTVRYRTWLGYKGVPLASNQLISWQAIKRRHAIHPTEVYLSTRPCQSPIFVPGIGSCQRDVEHVSCLARTSNVKPWNVASSWWRTQNYGWI